MGSAVSQEVCRTHFNTTLKCEFRFDPVTQEFYVPNLKPGEFESNPDIAGDGVLYAFFVISALAVALSAIYWLIQLFGQFPCWNIYGTTRPQKSPKRPEESKRTHSKASKRLVWLAVFEGVILSCSDQQIFASGAYAITLQYIQHCKISTYHYNIVGNMLLMTCATHVSSAIVVPQHRREKGRFILLLRIALVILIFTVTGYTLINQNVIGDNQNMIITNYWPTEVPAPDQKESLLVRPAACFGFEDTAILDTLKETFETEEQFLKVMNTSRPANFINGWNLYIIMLIIYAATLIVEFIVYGTKLILKCCCPSSRYTQKSYGKKLVAPHYTTTTYKYKYAQVGCGKRLCYWAFRIWQAFGIAVCIYTVLKCFLYIRALKLWMNGSEWIARDPITGLNPEKDGTTFGQLVPMLLTLLTVFTIVQSVEEKFVERRKQNKQDRRDIESHNTSPNNSKSFLDYY